MQTSVPSVADRSTAARRRLAAEVGLALATGLLAALAKRYFDLSIGVPGHSGLGWVGVLVAGAVVNPRAGMAVLAGASMGVWGIPIGLGHSALYNTALYGSASLALEALRRLRVPLSRAWGAALAGMAVHVVKFGYVLAYSAAAGVLRNFRVWGAMPALWNHVGFGLGAGLVGWAAARGLVPALRRTRWR